MVRDFDPGDATMIGHPGHPGVAPPARETAAQVAAAAAAQAAPQAGGQTLRYAGRYQIEREVGRGGMGTVYRALDVMVGDVVALKVLDAASAPSNDQLEWFRREVRLARRITHPNVARTHDMGEQDGAHYITMEFVEGSTLHDLLGAVDRGADEVVDEHAPRRRQALDPSRAVAIAIAVCDGLAAAHAAGVVHRDLKPANVLLERSGRVVLTDFGIARALTDEQVGARTQGIVGTPLYMAPEQLSGAAIDGRADVYALGLMLFEMLTGTLPFSGGTPLAAALARLTQKPPDPRALRPGLSPTLATLVLDCLAVKPDDRPASAAAVAERLRLWQTAEGDTQRGPATVGDSTTSRLMAGPGTTRTTSRTPGPALMPVPRPQQSLAVLPFRHVGPSEQSYLGDALTDELIDVLSRTRGLRVLGSGATAKYRTDRDPRAVAADLGVGAIVDATVHSSATQLRVAVRLIEVETGTQLWSDRFDSGLEDLFAVQERICKRIAEALRVELGSVTHMGEACAEGVGLYLRGRRKLLQFRILGPDSAIELLEQCLAVAPDLTPALACHAIACMRAWFVPAASRPPDRRGPARDWASEAVASVARALEHAPDLAETHLARGMLAVQRGEWREAVRALVKALDIAPTYAHAHQYLAQLQVESGNTKEGLERARLAFDLEPSLIGALLDMARLYALRGEWELYEAVLDEARRHVPGGHVARSVRIRVAAWLGDRQALRDFVDDMSGEDVEGFSAFLLGYARAVIGDITLAQVEALVEDQMSATPSPRFFSLMCQLATEIYCAIGDPELALSYFLRATDSVLIDLEWADRCPLLASIRGLPGYAPGRLKLRKRVQAMWSL